MILYKCDRCGEVHESIGEMTDVAISHAGTSTINYPRDGKFQVCKKCEIKLLNTLNAFGAIWDDDNIDRLFPEERKEYVKY